MNSDAKIGLLLGLVFIVIISFLINGLPDLFREDSGGAFTTAVIDVPVYKGPADQADQALQTVRFLKIPPEQPIEPGVSAEGGLQEPRFVESSVDIVAVRTPQDDNSSRQQEATPSGQQKVEVYVINSGDNLASIAKKFYGSEYGNRYAVIEQLYNYNKDKLKSADILIVGDKLRIPPLSSLNSGNPGKDIFASGLFEKVKDITGGGVSVLKTAVGLGKCTTYTVGPGDCLWQIAENRLGDGNRYSEIVQLNNILLADPEQLEVGMVINLPSR